MSFEEEVIPLFIGGVAIVSTLELIAGCVILGPLKRVRGYFIAHTAAMLAAHLFLIRSLFANWLGVELGIASISNSVNIGLFGLLWAGSVLFLLAAVAAVRDGRQDA